MSVQQSAQQVAVGTDVWVHGGSTGVPTRGTVTEVMTDGIRTWGIRVKTGMRWEKENGDAYATTSVFLRPQQRELLIRRLMDECDVLSHAIKNLQDEDDEEFEA